MTAQHHVDEAAQARSLRGDDALARAAVEIASPRRRLLDGLRDAHAETAARIERLRRLSDNATLARLLAEAEEQLRRIELLLAQMAERPRPCLAGSRDAPPPASLAAEELAGAAEARRLRDLAHLASQHLAARLLDLTAQERAATAAALAATQRH